MSPNIFWIFTLCEQKAGRTKTLNKRWNQTVTLTSTEWKIIAKSEIFYKNFVLDNLLHSFWAWIRTTSKQLLM